MRRALRSSRRNRSRRRLHVVRFRPQASSVASGALLRQREDRIRDLGGIVLEMIRRDEFRDDLVYEQAAELIGLEDRLHEVEAPLAAATTVCVGPPVGPLHLRRAGSLGIALLRQLRGAR